MASEFKSTVATIRNRMSIRNNYANPHLSRLLRTDELQFYTWSIKDVIAQGNIKKNNLIKWISMNLDILDGSLAIIGRNRVIIDKDDLIEFFDKNYIASDKYKTKNGNNKYLPAKYQIVFRTVFIERFKNILNKFEEDLNVEYYRTKHKRRTNSVAS